MDKLEKLEQEIQETRKELESVKMELERLRRQIMPIGNSTLGASEPGDEYKAVVERRIKELTRMDSDDMACVHRTCDPLRNRAEDDGVEYEEPEEDWNGEGGSVPNA